MTLTDEERMAYALAEAEERYRVEATARSKLVVVEALAGAAVGSGQPTLVIGRYIDQEFAARRQRFLAEQGDAYEIVDAETVLER